MFVRGVKYVCLPQDEAELTAKHTPTQRPAQAVRRHADIMGMARLWILALLFSLLSGCGGKAGRMEQPEDPQGRYREQIAVAKRLLEQKEQWADRAEWEVLKSGDGWEVIAWRVEHPENKGASRYLPWGYSVIELDSRLMTIGYHRKG